jgi:endonuclease/exonuclease/phosphatase (EEP) superfamily protein YafD
VLPLLHLDHIYYDGPLELLALEVHRTRKSLVASDHLPLVANFKYLKGVEPATEPPGTEVVKEA